MSTPEKPVSPEQLEQAYQRYAQGETLLAIATTLHISRTRLWNALNETPAHRETYARATARHGEALAERGYEAAVSEQDPKMERLARLRFDAGKWLAAMSNARYRDRMIQDHEGEVVVRLVDETTSSKRELLDAEVVEESITPVAEPLRIVSGE